jgi:biotin synthase
VNLENDSEQEEEEMIAIEKRVSKILDHAYAGIAPTREDCVHLLEFRESSCEAFATRAAAATIIRERTGNAGVIYGQIGVAASPCEANCSFCSFAQDYTGFGEMQLDMDDLAQRIRDFSKGGDMYGLSIMTMHKYDLAFFLEAVRVARENAPKCTRIASNVGDTSYEDFVEMKKAGLDSVYHACRMGEGKYTTLDPKQRRKTMENAKKAGLEHLDTLEPIGPEHTPRELVEHMFIPVEMESIMVGAMKRISVPGTPFENSDMITDFRLSQILAVQALATLALKKTPWILIHEPNQMGLLSGGNLICPEIGVNPRDTENETANNRGFDVDACRRMLYEAGFEYLSRGDDSRTPLTMKYIEEKAKL